MDNDNNDEEARRIFDYIEAGMAQVVFTQKFEYIKITYMFQMKPKRGMWQLIRCNKPIAIISIKTHPAANTARSNSSASLS